VPCFLALLAILSPRLALIIAAIFSDILSRAYDSWIVPLIGFFVLPWTTLAYAGMWSAGSNHVYGFEWFIVVLAFVLDLGSYVGGYRRD
jgi:large-conductance mechanosensitive channel